MCFSMFLIKLIGWYPNKINRLVPCRNFPKNGGTRGYHYAGTTTSTNANPVFNYANADSYSSELSIDCDAISKLKNIEGVTSKNIKSYLLETIKNEALREAVLNDNFDAQQTICDAEAARSASIFDAGFVKIFLAFLVMALGGFGLGYLWIRFRHEWKTWYEPTDGKN